MTETEPVAPLEREERWAGWLATLNAPRDGAGLAVYRVLLGALLCFSVARFWSYGWIEQLYIEPGFHFTYYGFDWVRPWPGAGMYLHFALMGAAALSLCVGFMTRASALIFFVTFTYAELIEKASYLNHYYFVSLVALLLSLMPSGACLSVDAALRRRRGQPPLVVRSWMYALLRAQLTIVYFFAGLAKLGADWLLSAEPLRTWLSLHADAPLVGPLLAAPATAYFASYAGAAFDLTIPLWLSLRRTRAYAFAVAVFFHVGVWLLFPIGVFSWVMLASITSFFDPSWPRAWLRRVGREPASPALAGPSGRLSRAGAGLLVAYVLVQAALPLRHLLYPGEVNWHEQGFRFAWRVMLVEKAGHVELKVVADADDKTFIIYPREQLTPLQYKMMSTQPDMIQQFARHLKASFVARGHERVRVYAEAWASLNGRSRQRLVDPEVDLGSAPWSLAPKRWILPLQNSI